MGVSELFSDKRISPTLKKGGTVLQVPLFKGDLGGSWHLLQAVKLDKTASKAKPPPKHVISPARVEVY
jgi:hypothetical protein